MIRSCASRKIRNWVFRGVGRVGLVWACIAYYYGQRVSSPLLLLSSGDIYEQTDSQAAVLLTVFNMINLRPKTDDMVRQRSETAMETRDTRDTRDSSKPGGKSRKVHTKSRNGCLECKRRHIRCDQTHPKCDRCIFSNRACEYATPKAVFKPKGPTLMSDTSTSNRANSGQQSLDGTTPSGNSGHLLGTDAASAYPLPSVAEINLTHLQLLHHFEAETCRAMAATEAHVATYQRAIVAHGLRNQHLMYQILALSALHLGVDRPGQQHFYHAVASELESKALEGFKQRMESIDRSNCFEAVLFSHLIAVHVLRDAFNTLNDHINVFLDRLVGGIRLVHRIRSVTSHWESEFRQSELGALVEDVESQQLRRSLGECGNLHEMVARADISAESIQQCHHGINQLQELLDVENSRPSPSPWPHMTFAWLVTAAPSFTDLIDERIPEAFVILAYYAVLLHKQRHCWVIGDSGVRLFDMVSQYLGQHWRGRLAWPRSVLRRHGKAPGNNEGEAEVPDSA